MYDKLPEFLFPKIEPLNGGFRYPPLASTLLLETRKVMMRASARAMTATLAMMTTTTQRVDHGK